MKLFSAIFFVSVMALSAQDPQANPPARKAAAKTAAKSAPKAAPKVTNASTTMTIPATAVLGSDGDYHFSDPQGKKWIYRKTPFGLARLEDTPERAAAQSAPAIVPGIKATEVGDMVRFERLGPFGLWKWEKKKSELDESEKAALQNSQANNQSGSKQESKPDSKQE